MAFDSNNPADFTPTGPRMNALSLLGQGTPAAAGASAGQNPRQAYYAYLQQHGYTGAMGPDMHAYAQQLRASGQHPWLDFWHSQNPGMGGATQGNGAGINPNPGPNPMSFPPIGGANGNTGIVPPSMRPGGGYQPGPDPRPMAPLAIPLSGDYGAARRINPIPRR